jgi:hypothetical protein
MVTVLLGAFVMNTVSALVGSAPSDQLLKPSQNPPDGLDQLLVCAEPVLASVKVQRVRTKESPPCNRKNRGAFDSFPFTHHTQVINRPAFAVDDKTHGVTRFL